MVADCGVFIQGTVIRVVALTTCGAPVTGASSAEVVTDGYISINAEPQYEDGDEFVGKKANGTLCYNKLTESSLKRSNLTTTVCVFNPDLLVLVSGGRLIANDGVTGTGIAMLRGLVSSHYSMETWLPMSGPGACTPGGQQKYLYNAWPHVFNTQIQGWTVENGPLELSWLSNTEAPSVLWGDSPGTAGPWLPADIVGDEDWIWNITTTPPPTPPENCGAVLLV
jgi:hypothetical protein